LRLHDHAALNAALAHTDPVQPIFIFDTNILARFTNPADRRLTFLAHTLCALNAELQQRGGNLLVLHGDAESIVPRLARSWNAQIFASEDYEPATRARDAIVAPQAQFTLVKDHLIFSPAEVVKGDGTPFKVFTPYANAWRAKLSPGHYGEYPIDDANRYAKLAAPDGFKHIDLAGGPASVLAQIGYKPADISHWPVSGARANLAQFISAKAQNYPNTRDMMGLDGTSRVSPYLRFGLVSVREALRLAMEQGSAAKWIAELIWREFYAMILFHYPDSAHSEWNPKFRTLKWSKNPQHFAVWCEGRTGYPVVDAAMRQLVTTGWMHNRARMIVASFLTKDLQIDWRMGEEFFAQHLMDYEMASNVGGWQWSASTGTDAQPWFRIFNPYLQSEKFDPNGDYIRAHLPELAHLKTPAIHNPKPLERGPYPAPIVDHAKARETTLLMFKSL